MKQPLVCIIVLNYNGKEVIRTCLNSLLKHTSYPNYRVIVVDNGSSDGSREIIKKEYEKVQLLELPENVGFSKGMNAGARNALKGKPEFLLFLNNDIEIKQKKWLERLVNTLENSSAGIAGPRTVKPDGSTDETGFYFDKRIRGKIKKPAITAGKQETDIVTGACVLVKTEVLKKIGLYDERFTPYLFEDIDLFCRARKAGYKIIYNPEAVITHLGSHSINKINSENVKINEYKNFIRFAYKHYPFPLFTLAFLNTVLSQLIRNPLSLPELFARIDLRKEKTTSA